MLLSRFSKAAGAAAAFAAIVLAGMLINPPRGQAQGDENDGESKVERGLAIAPVPLNLKGRNRELVGLGSYIVNAQGDCNGCHTMDPSTEYTATGNPYLLDIHHGGPFKGKTQVNPKTYLGGGSDFGAFPGPGPFPHIVSRNLTPDKTGRPEGGRTFQEFLTIMKTGKDYDHLHPTCTGAPNGTCLPAPFNGELLQIMPWPTFQNMSRDEIRAIYEYLSAIPCIDTVVAGQPQLRNVCQ